MSDFNILDLPPLHETEAWAEEAHEVPEDVKHITEFISKLALHVTFEQEARLNTDDLEAWDEAKQTGGLVDYKRGERGEAGEDKTDRIARNRCKWRNRELAKRAVHLPKHLSNVRYMVEDDLFEDFVIRSYDVTHEDGRAVLHLESTMTKDDVMQHARWQEDEVSVSENAA